MIKTASCVIKHRVATVSCMLLLGCSSQTRLGPGDDNQGGQAASDGPPAEASIASDVPENVAAIMAFEPVVKKDNAGNIVELQFTQGRADDTILVHLKGLPHLSKLTLYGPKFTDTGVANLKDVSSIRYLYLPKAEVKDAGLEAVGDMQQLEALDLQYTPITDDGMRHVAKLARLRFLGLLRTKISDAGMAHLAPLSNMQSLDLRDSFVTGAGLQYLAGMTQDA